MPESTSIGIWRNLTIREIRAKTARNLPGRVSKKDFHPLTNYYPVSFLQTFWFGLKDLVDRLLSVLGSHRGKRLEEYIARSRAFAFNRICENIGKNAGPDVLDGVVIASPSNETFGNEPDYYYTWTRDSALVMKLFVHEILSKGQNAEQAEVILKDYISANEVLVANANPSGTWKDHGLGEPKFHVDGSAFTKTWGRPQNDGPALRVVTLSAYFLHLKSSNRDNAIIGRLYNVNGKGLQQGLIKIDCDYILRAWKEIAFDLWEEINTHSFFTLMVQRRALLDGACVADSVGDTESAKAYREAVDGIILLLRKCYDNESGRILCAVDPAKFNRQGNDASVFLGIIHGRDAGDCYREFDLADEHMLRSLYEFQECMRKIYRINNYRLDAPCCGRYPEDIYDGHGTTGGHPWFLTTAGMAQCHYMLAHMLKDKAIKVTEINLPFFQQFKTGILSKDVFEPKSTIHSKILKNLMKLGDSYLDIVREYSGEGTLSEQFDRDTGRKIGAISLTWSHVALLGAISARSGSFMFQGRG